MPDCLLTTSLLTAMSRLRSGTIRADPIIQTEAKKGGQAPSLVTNHARQTMWRPHLAI